MNLLKKNYIYTSRDDLLLRRPPGALMSVYAAGECLYVFVFEESKMEEPFRSVTNSTDFLYTLSREILLKDIAIDKFINSKWILFTGYEEDHPYRDMGYSRVNYLGSGNQRFEYIGTELRNVWEYVLMWKLKNYNEE